MRLPLGLNSTQEVFHRKIRELVERIEGIEVIADDFLIVGVGNSHLDHDKKLLEFFLCCEERGIVVNITKLQLQQWEMPFIGQTQVD